ncbi:DNA polymerase III, tau and gamma subunits; DNA elongation factor III [Xenorhabdus bovienii str. Jollieti]|uniref:DNA polymerase III subunit gamma/tau n=1 Tax=Xenorhabdus bovienii (strain SS-2004) TaxID=406818 RepID=D3V0A4_XENBS|nr:DNA polymerase III subunit gamma/tau [Xenorhabdus bovienii]CBJ80737.1 DNA polymerase III, tau and gamma subunits; DNA elongation factor III [Xenorhabdus bovienii SS-2004]CDH30449.1 DNA polymerase III, tau and gamma subunits; DNA elongation factor III [Xenorhabdus bovienii str. Jollieti]
MSYQVLARKWRPQIFSDVIGQQHVLTALANGLEHQRLHHAYLFSGTRGVGKTTIARLLAKGLNCETGITKTPCGQCANCLEIEQGRFVDLIEIDAASRTKVEDTRELLDNVQYAPARGRFKVYLIDEVHMLSRHSFNALLKTLEEPPEHVKFLLATTDPQKLPVTILSRCLQFHLKALNVDQISGQLEHVLNAEQIESDSRARHLLARAADGSMRDALSLTDQAIALGGGKLTADIVSQMLGTLDNDQPLEMIEWLVRADGQQLMALVEQIASRGVDWEHLLVDILSLLHRIAMLQLLPQQPDNDPSSMEGRLRLLARSISPADLQLFYQALLVGRKDLPYAPERRMGVEMALLRALAFHPKTIIEETPASGGEIPVVPQVSASAQRHPVSPVQNHVAGERSENGSEHSSPQSMSTEPVISSPTAKLLQARHSLTRQGNTPPKKSEPAEPVKAKSASSALERLAAVAEQRSQSYIPKAQEPKPIKQEAYRWRTTNTSIEEKPVCVTTPKAIKAALEHEKTPELAEKLAVESKQRDSWSAEIDKLNIPKLVQQVALNAFKEQIDESRFCLHLRSKQRHLNSASAQQMLSEALSELHGKPIELRIIEDDNPAVKTPLEWRQAIYEEKLAQARQSIISDRTIQTLQQLFDAELDEESIRPV